MVFALIIASPASAQEVFKTVNEDGVVSFTDFAVPGAERLDIEPIAADPEGAEASSRLIEQQLEVAKSLIEQQLEVAKSLEESRLARRRAETERRVALAASQPQTIYYPVERDTGFWGWPGYGYRPGRPPWRPGVRPPYRPGYPAHPIAPGHPRPPAARPPSQSRPLPMRK
jgi:hypothetical protein